MDPLTYLQELLELLRALRTRHEDAIAMYLNMVLRANDTVFGQSPSDVSRTPFVIDYKNRKHLFAYNASGTAITLTDVTGLWSTNLPTQTWVNIAFPAGTRLVASAPANFVWKATDEIVP